MLTKTVTAFGRTALLKLRYIIAKFDVGKMAGGLQTEQWHDSGAAAAARNGEARCRQVRARRLLLAETNGPSAAASERELADVMADVMAG